MSPHVIDNKRLKTLKCGQIIKKTKNVPKQSVVKNLKTSKGPDLIILLFDKSLSLYSRSYQAELVILNNHANRYVFGKMFTTLMDEDGISNSN